MPKCDESSRVTVKEDHGCFGSGAFSALEGVVQQLGHVCEELRWEFESLQEENSSLRLRLRLSAPKSLITALPTFPSNSNGTSVSSSSPRGDVRSARVQSGEYDKSSAPSSHVVSAQDPVLIMPSSAGSTPRVADESTPNGDTPDEVLIPSKLERRRTARSAKSCRLKPEWEETLTFNDSLTGLAVSTGSHVPAHSHAPKPVEVYMGSCAKLISFPGSPHRIAWDLLGFIFIFYDLVIIPLRAFDPPENIATEVMDWVILVYWTLHVGASLQVGYVSKGITIMNPRKIFIHYLKTWCLLDLIVLVPDWYYSAHQLSAKDSTKHPGDAVKLLRNLRLSKCLRLLRFAKLKKIMQHMNDRIASEYTGILVNILKMIFLLLLVNHYIASFWFIIGSIDMKDNIPSWVKTYGFDNKHWLEQYTISLQWSITQFTPASKADVQPQNIVERSFAICVVLFALIGFSYILGSITGSLGQLRNIAEDAEQQFWQVRRYLRQHTVSPALGTRIQRFLEHAYAKSRKRTEVGNIRIFRLLSHSLRSELQLEIALPQLKAHPLFVQLSQRYMPTLRRIATTCIHYQNLAHGDVLFFPGENATHMYFLVSGLLKYIAVPSRSNEEPASEWVEGREDWIAEPTLWLTTWVHRGTPTATLESEVLLVHPKDFADTVKLNPAAFESVSAYAHLFLEWLKQEGENAYSDIYQGEQLFPVFAAFCGLVDFEHVSKRPHRSFTLRRG